MFASTRRFLLILAALTAVCRAFCTPRTRFLPRRGRALPRSPSASANAPLAAPSAVSTETVPAPSGATTTAPPRIWRRRRVGTMVLSPSDTVEMTVFHEPDLATQTKIGSDGSAQFPLIGEIKIAGMAMRDARELIRRRYNADYLVDPQVYLNVVGYAGRKFTILGQVNKPGTYDFPPGEQLSLLEAVGVAGGFTRLADRGAVVIKRVGRGTEQTLKVNAKNLAAKDGKPFALASGDVITVGESWF